MLIAAGPRRRTRASQLCGNGRVPAVGLHAHIVSACECSWKSRVEKGDRWTSLRPATCHPAYCNTEYAAMSLSLDRPAGARETGRPCPRATWRACSAQAGMHALPLYDLIGVRALTATPAVHSGIYSCIPSASPTPRIKSPCDCWCACSSEVKKRTIHSSSISKNRESSREQLVRFEGGKPPQLLAVVTD